MPEFHTIKEYIERRTYINGRFRGKFIGYLDRVNSDLIHENFYDLEVISGEIKAKKDDTYIRHWQDGEPEVFQPVKKFLTKLPQPLPLEILYPDGSFKYYRIQLNEPKLSNYFLDKQLYEEDKIFGDIYGDISGFIRHYDEQETEVEIPDENTIEQIHPVTRTLRPAHTSETQLGYQREAYYNSNGTTYWGNWTRKDRTRRFSFWNSLSGFFKILCVTLFLLPLMIMGWKVIAPVSILITIIVLLSLLGPIITGLLRWGLRLLGLVFFLGFAFSFARFITSGIPAGSKKNNTVSGKETQKRTSDPVTGDSLIVSHRIWEDYQGKQYEGNIKVKVSDFNNAATFRNSIRTPLETDAQYQHIVSVIYTFDKNKLGLLYKMFDSLKLQHHPDQKAFAELITSCIQDIPYTLVLNDNCDASLYNDAFISDYLGKGGRCEGFIKFGLLAPTEFMGSLVGDCDTRTLLLFTILNHYSYDVAMLSSEFYRHSVIGINLPYHGIKKTINGKSYVLWETTREGIPPGIIPPEISDTRLWNITLISNHNQSI